ncbi:hypothetical protein [Sphingopyxis fribergensis]
MGRRKGERRIVREVREYNADHPVAISICSGSRWFDAWVAQMATPYPVLTKRTKLAEDRLLQFSHDAEPTSAEIEVLAATWYVTPEGLLKSIVQAKARR